MDLRTMTAIILMLLLFLPEAAMRPQPAGIDDKQPVPGDVLTFSMEPSQSKPGQMVAKNVEGSTGVKEMPQFPAEPAPEIAGSGANVGKVRTWNDTKGYGFIDLPGQPNVWLHVKECINTQPQQGDWVRFDVQPSETKPGQMVAKNVTGGSQPLGQRGYGPVSSGGAGAVAAAGYSPYGVTGLTAGALQGVAGYAVQVQQPALTALPGGGYVLQQSLPVQAVPQQGLQQGLYGVAGMQQYAIQQPGVQQLQQLAVQPGLQQFAVQPGMQQFALQQPGVQQLLQPGMQQYLQPAMMQQPLMQQQTLLQQPVGLQDAAAGLPVMADPSQAALQAGGAIEAPGEAQAPPVPPPPEPLGPLGAVPQDALPAAPQDAPAEHPEQAVQPGEHALPPAPAPQEAPGDASVAAQLAAVVGGPPPPPPADAATPQ
ncbi:unnamed protein product [Symbiodinium sp. KB8]|nr:unnamed protein product [Symbiodinium sp. KB8]